MYIRCVYTYFQFNVMAYNPIARKTESVMAFPVSSESVEVLDENGKQVTAQVCVFPVWVAHSSWVLCWLAHKETRVLVL